MLVGPSPRPFRFTMARMRSRRSEPEAAQVAARALLVEQDVAEADEQEGVLALLRRQRAVQVRQQRGAASSCRSRRCRPAACRRWRPPRSCSASAPAACRSRSGRGCRRAARPRRNSLPQPACWKSCTTRSIRSGFLSRHVHDAGLELPRVDGSGAHAQGIRNRHERIPAGERRDERAQREADAHGRGADRPDIALRHAVPPATRQAITDRSGRCRSTGRCGRPARTCRASRHRRPRALRACGTKPGSAR